MSKVKSKVTVYFEDPFWGGIFERYEDGKLSVCKVTFGAEPKDYEVEKFILRNYSRLRFSHGVDAVMKDMKTNPKRMQRDARKQMQETGIGTKSQQALKLMQEMNKQERKATRQEQKAEEEQRRFELKQKKKKEKHRGHGIGAASGRCRIGGLIGCVKNRYFRKGKASKVLSDRKKRKHFDKVSMFPLFCCEITL